MRALISYHSYSGNTEEVALLIKETLCKQHHTVTLHEVGIDPVFDPNSYDVIFLGTFTWVSGSVPEEVKDMILEIGYKPDNIAVFGTGETQFAGDNWYCKAVDSLVNFYNSPYEGLKIEQSPRGSQEQLVVSWTERVMENVKQKVR